MAVLATSDLSTARKLGLGVGWLALWLLPALFSKGWPMLLSGFVPQTLAIGLCVGVLVRGWAGATRVSGPTASAVA